MALPAVKVEKEEELVDVEVCTGHFLDAIQRAATPVAKSSGTADQLAVCRAMVARLLTPADQKEILKQTGTEHHFAKAVEAVNRERTVYAVMERVKTFFRAKQNPAWSSSSKTFLQTMREIARLKRFSHCLRKEVETKTLLYKVTKQLQTLHEYIRHRESAEERLERLGEFWPQLHNLTAELPELSSPSRPQSVVCVGFGLESQDVLQNFDEIRPVSACSIRGKDGQRGVSPQRLDWKTRATRSHRSIGTWGSIPEGGTAGLTLDKLNHEPQRSSSKQRIGPGLGVGNHASMSLRQLKATNSSWGNEMRAGSLSTGNLPALTKSLFESFPGAAGTAKPARGIGVEAELPMFSASPKLKRPPSAKALKVKLGADVYLKACARQMLVPCPSAFATGHSNKIDERGKSLTDVKLATIAETASRTAVEEVALDDNGQVSDKGLAAFVDALTFGPSANVLKKLSLAGCKSGGPHTAEAIHRLLTTRDASNQLFNLNLTGVQIGVQFLLPLCQAVKSHPRLTVLNISSTGFGRVGSAHTIRCVQEILSSKHLTNLDIGWNVLAFEDFAALGETVSKAGSVLTRLSMACCATAIRKGTIKVSPVALFLENLSNGAKLRYLDMSLNRIDFLGALVIEDALGQLHKLSELVLNYNPLGVLGMRSLLRLLSMETSGLLSFECESCSFGHRNLNDFVYQPTNPCGFYQLDMTRPYHRAALRMLYKTCDRLGIRAEDAFQSVAYTTPAPTSYRHPAIESDGVRRVVNVGMLNFSFTLVALMEKTISKTVKDHEFDLLIQEHTLHVRTIPSFRKLSPLLVQWGHFNGLRNEQLNYLQALAKDFLLPFACIEELARTQGMTAEVLSILFHTVREPKVSLTVCRYLCRLLSTDISDSIKINVRVQSLMLFNPENPTGHYRLDLSNFSDFAVAEQLILLDTWEIFTQRRRKKADTSQYGNMSQVRNVKHEELPLQVTCIVDWLLPDSGICELDYASAKRPLPNAVMLDEVTFSYMLSVIQDQMESFNAAEAAHGKGEQKIQLVHYHDIQALRLISHHIHLSSLQMRELLGVFSERQKRADCFVTFFNRVCDMYNEKVFRVRFEDESEVRSLRERLGFISYFPFIQPEQAIFSLNFAMYDERLAANSLILLANKERNTNIKKPVYVRADGSIDPLPLGVPRSWETFAKMPTEGVFNVYYVCSPEDRNFKERKRLYEDYGCWIPNFEEHEVKWWGSLSEPPVEVLEFLEFLVSRFDNVMKPFRKMNGCTGGGGSDTISLREFEEGIADLQCKKFAGPNEKEKIELVFRYLDPSGEGQVSVYEWGILECFWNEIKLSIQEFVKFCQRKFGDDLCDAWDALNSDGSPDIDYQEYIGIVREHGYFGQTRPIFNFLDKDDEGSISFGEFETLREYQTAKRPDPHAVIAYKDTFSRHGNRFLALRFVSIRISVPARRSTTGTGAAAQAAASLGHSTVLRSGAGKASTQSGVRLIAAATDTLQQRSGRNLCDEVSSCKEILTKEKHTEIVCEITPSGVSSPAGIYQELYGLLDEEADNGLVSAFRFAGATAVPGHVEVRWSLERLQLALSATLPGAEFGYQPLGKVAEYANASMDIFGSILVNINKKELESMRDIKVIPSSRLFDGILMTLEEGDAQGLVPDPVWSEAMNFSELFADTHSAQRGLKQLLAPGSEWATSSFPLVDEMDYFVVPQDHPSHRYRTQATDLVPSCAILDPGVPTRDMLKQACNLVMKKYEVKAPVWTCSKASSLHLVFDSIEAILKALKVLQDTFDVVSVSNQFKTPRCLGYGCVELVVRQSVLDSRREQTEIRRAALSTLTLHHKDLWKALQGPARDCQQALLAVPDLKRIPNLNDIIKNSLDCMAADVKRVYVDELQHLSMFLQLYPQYSPEEVQSLGDLLTELSHQALLAGLRKPQVARIFQHCKDVLQRLSPELASWSASPPGRLDKSRGDDIAAIRAKSSRFWVDWVELEKRNGEVLRFGCSKEQEQRTALDESRALLHAEKMNRAGVSPQTLPVLAETTELILSDDEYIVAVEQGSRGTGGCMGNRIAFQTSAKRSIEFKGTLGAGTARVRFEALPGLQIIDLIFEFGRLVALRTTPLQVQRSR